MFNKNLALLLTTIHAWMIVVFSAIWVIYSIFEAGDMGDTAEGIGAFAALIVMGFAYFSVWYLAIYLFRKAIENK